MAGSKDDMPPASGPIESPGTPTKTSVEEPGNVEIELKDLKDGLEKVRQSTTDKFESIEKDINIINKKFV